MSDLASLYIRVDSSGVVTASRDLANFEGVAQKTEGATRKVETATQSMSSSFNKLKSVVAGLVTTYAALQLARFTADMVMSQVAMERMTVALKAATGSATAAASEMAYIRAESQRLGLSLQDQAKAYTKLAAASKGTSLEGKATRDIFTAISEASTALQLSSDESAGALYAIGQMMSKGTVQAEELRGQLGERLPGAFQVAAKAMGVSTAELGKMLEQGKVMSDDFLPKFAKALHDHYAGAIDDAARSSSANLNRMKTAIFELKVAIGEAFGSSTLGAMQAVTTALEKMKKEMESPEAKEAIAALSAEFEKLVINAGQNAPNAIRKTLEALNGIMTFYNALPPEIVEAAGMGIIGRMLFGAGPGKIIATLSLINSALSRFNMNLGSMVSKYREGAGAFQNVIDVVTGKRDWNTGKARGVGINPFNENVMTGKGSSVPGIDMEAIIGPYPKTATATSLGTSASPKLPTGVDKSVSAKAANSAQKLAEEWEKTSKELGLKIDSDGLDEFDSALLKLQYDADKAKKEYEKLPAAIRATAYAKIDAAQQAGINELTTKAAQKDFDEYCKREKEKADLVKKTAAEKLKAERDLYKDLRGYEVEAYDGTIKLIQNQAQKYKDLGIDEVVVKKWAAEETRKAELQKAEYSDDFFEGVKAGYNDIVAHQTKWGRAGIDTVKNFSNKASDTLANVFFDAYKGELKSAKNYFKSFANSMAQDFSRVLSRMVTDAAISKITMVFDAGWTQHAQSILGLVGKAIGYATDWLFENGSVVYDEISSVVSSAGSALVNALSFAHGGWVPGYAYGGNSPRNDTVRTLLSPGEYVVDRENIQAIARQGNNGDTMLAHINPAEAALLKTLGGAGTINERTGLPQFYTDPQAEFLGVDWTRYAKTYEGFVNLYNKIYANSQSINPYQYPNADTGWIKKGDDYYWPVAWKNEDGRIIKESVRHLRPGEKKKKRSAGVFSAIGTAIGTYLYPGIGTAIGAWMGSAIDGVNDPEQLATSSAIAGATAYVGSQLDLGSLFGLSGSTTPSGMNPYGSYIMGGNNVAAAELAYGGAGNLGTFTGNIGSYFATNPELFLSSLAPLDSYAMGGGMLPTMTYAIAGELLNTSYIKELGNAMGKTILKNMLKKTMVGSFFGEAGFGGKSSQNNLSISYAGATGGSGLMDLLAGLTGTMQNKFAFSARNGGIFTGPENGYQGQLHGTEAVVPLPNGRSIPVDMTGGNKELLEEIKGLRSDLRAGNLAEVKNTGKIMKLLDQVISGSINADGYPAMRTVTA